MQLEKKYSESLVSPNIKIVSINNQFHMELRMIWPHPATLSLHTVWWESLSKYYLDDLIIGNKDGKLYDPWYASILEKSIRTQI